MRAELDAVALDVHLEIEPEAPRIPVRGAEQRPRAVHHQQLRMVERPGPAPHAAAVVEHLPELAEHRPAHVRQVAHVGNHDVDLDPAQRRGVERRDQRLVGNEVGREDLDRALRRVQPAEDRPAHALERFVRPRLDGARQHGAFLAQRRKPFRPAQCLSGGELPVVGEDFHELRHDRPAQAELQVAKRLLRRLRPPIAGVDVQAAGEAHRGRHQKEVQPRPRVHGPHPAGPGEQPVPRQKSNPRRTRRGRHQDGDVGNRRDPSVAGDALTMLPPIVPRF